jgi:hypothetical protein
MLTGYDNGTSIQHLYVHGDLKIHEYDTGRIVLKLENARLGHDDRFRVVNGYLETTKSCIKMKRDNDRIKFPEEIEFSISKEFDLRNEIPKVQDFHSNHDMEVKFDLGIDNNFYSKSKNVECIIRFKLYDTPDNLLSELREKILSQVKREKRNKEEHLKQITDFLEMLEVCDKRAFPRN